MSHFDHLDLDGHLLQLLLAVLEEGSITRAAQRLGVTQSAVSHLLDKLRDIVGDPLFVKSGRGIVPTAHAHALGAPARVMLDQLRSFSHAAGFDPAALAATVTIAANDLQRDLLLPTLLRYVRTQAPGFALRVVSSGEGSDILQKRLFEDRYRIFYDASQRDAPRSREEYLAADHVSVLYEPRRRLDIDEVLAARGLERRFVALVPGFAGIGPFLRGSTTIATLPSLLRAHLLSAFDIAPVPIDCPTMPMYMVWHLRHHADPMHCWLRRQLEMVVAPSLAGAAEHVPPPGLAN